MSTTRSRWRLQPRVEAVESRVALNAEPWFSAPGFGLEAASALVRVDVNQCPLQLTPLTRLGPGDEYQGLDGGLYGDGCNAIPAALLCSAMAAADRIVPLNARGVPAQSGRVGTIIIGQSTTRQWAPIFQALARALPRCYVFVDVAQSGMVSQSWANTAGPWTRASRLVTASELSRAQVQVAILDSARIRTWEDGDLAQQIDAYRSDLARIVAKARTQYPNLRLVYLMPFHDASYCDDSRSVREPFAYQEAFGIRSLIRSQCGTAPLLVWGPYVWESTGNAAYFTDGIHLTLAGRRQMASLTWRFLQDDPMARRWLWNSKGN